MNAKRLLSLAAACAGLFVLAACDAPHDVEGTLERVRDGTLRVGVLNDETIQGQEKEWLERLAQRHGAELVYEPGETHRLVEALRNGEIDLLVSLPHDTPFKKEIGLSRSYRNAQLTPAKRVWAVRPGENAWLFEVDRALPKNAPR